MPEATNVEKECSEPERKQSVDGAADDSQGSGGADTFVVASPTASSPAVADTKPKKRTRAPAKKVAMEAPPVNVTDPLFFAGLNILHKRLEADARRTRFSSMSIA